MLRDGLPEDVFVLATYWYEVLLLGLLDLPAFAFPDMVT